MLKTILLNIVKGIAAIIIGIIVMVTVLFGMLKEKDIHDTYIYQEYCQVEGENK